MPFSICDNSGFKKTLFIRDLTSCALPLMAETSAVLNLEVIIPLIVSIWDFMSFNWDLMPLIAALILERLGVMARGGDTFGLCGVPGLRGGTPLFGVPTLGWVAALYNAS